MGIGQVSEKAESASTTITAKPKRRALLICNGQVPKCNFNLPGVVKDAENLKRVLSNSERTGFEVTRLLDEKLLPVRRAISKACMQSAEEDTLLIYFSGSGFCDENEAFHLTVADSELEYLTATCLDSDFLLTQMRQSRCRRFVLVVDSCYSGAFFNNNRGIPDGMVAITSCGPEEMSMETEEGGAFTQSFIRALTSGKADTDDDGCVSVDEVYDFIRNDKSLSKYATHPQKWVWNLSESILLTRSSLRVFLSYSSNDSEIADQLVTELERRGITVWRDISGVPGGSDWVKSLAKALGKSSAVLLLMTDNALESKWVERELIYADQERNLPIMPIVIDDIQAPDWFKLQLGRVQRQPLDLQSLENSADELATSIRKMVSVRAGK